MYKTIQLTGISMFIFIIMPRSWSTNRALRSIPFYNIQLTGISMLIIIIMPQSWIMNRALRCVKLFS
jgi:hypothetical protein